jgi:hypothetical protein
MCRGALDRFFDVFWPCSFRDSHGRACHNIRAGHESKGHQDRNGRIIGLKSSSAYQSNFSQETYQKKWLESIKENLTAFDVRLRQRRHSVGASQFKMLEAEDAFQLHLEEHLKVFFLERGGARNYFSLATCYCCLMKVPQHPLPCGHVLCTDCIKSYGNKLEHSSVSLDSCPLHPEESKAFGPWVIRFKPDFAGVRVLSLDG